MKSAIRVANLSKSYRLGSRTANSYRTLRDTISGSVAGVWHSLRRRLGGAGNGTGRGPAEDSTFWALKDVSFEVRPGEVVGVIGRNGAGKSTLLKILSRITEPTTGRCEVRGRMASLLEVGTGFHPELTGRENIYMNGSLLGMSRKQIERKFDEIVEFSEIEQFLDTPVKRYSSGMYVRLAFAVAAHLEPDILVVDEVLAVGDAKFQKKCLGKVGDIAKEGRTVILVSHNMHVIRNMCDSATLLVKGRVANRGNVTKVVDYYLNDCACGDARISWTAQEAPASREMRLRSVSVSGPDAIPNTVLHIDKEIQITFEYEVLTDVDRGYAAMWLKHIDGTEILASGAVPFVTSTPDEYCGKPMVKGAYQTVCRLPADFLNAGVYSVSAILGIGAFPGQLLEQDVLQFEVADTSEMRKEYQGGWIGVVRPKLPWHTVRLSF